jgi:hypothetical protein
MAETREVRTFATEAKFVVDAPTAAAVRDWARRQLSPDPHGGGEFGDEYHTTSVYFDTEGLDVFRRHGSFGRSRYRVRRYGDAGLVFLERKLREPTVLAKRRTAVSIEALAVLHHERPPGEWPGRWFQSRLAARRLRPVCRVAYCRTARVGQESGEAIRLTLDEDLTASACDEIGFEAANAVRVAGSRQILELKYRHHAPVLFKRLVETFGLSPQPVSKYRLGMAAIGRAPSGVDVPVITEDEPGSGAMRV